MIRVLLVIWGGLLVATWLFPAHGAEIRANIRDGLPTEIYFSGEITAADKVPFDTAMAKAMLHTKAWVNDQPYVVIVLDSPGGDVKTALSMGFEIRDWYVSTVVRDDATCASACVFLLQSGVTRRVATGASIGLHRPHFPADEFAALTPEKAREHFRELIDYLRDWWFTMGGSEAALSMMMNTPSDDVSWIRDPVKALELSIIGDDPSWGELTVARQSRH